MTGPYSWVSFASLVVALISLGVTVGIFSIGRRLSFRQKRERARELKTDAMAVLGPIRTKGLNSKIIVMNVDRYTRGYDGSNKMTWRGYVFTGPELIEIVHSGVEVIDKVIPCYCDDAGVRTLAKTAQSAANVLQIGHIPWDWIEHIEPEGDEFDGSAIFYVRHRAAGRKPYDHFTFRESSPSKFGLNNRDYYARIPELGTRKSQWTREWFQFLKELQRSRAID